MAVLSRYPAITVLASLLLSGLLVAAVAFAYLLINYPAGSASPWERSDAPLNRPMRVNLDAAGLPVLQLQLSALQPDTRLVLFWATPAAPGKFHYLDLTQAGNGSTSIALWRHPDWQGRITLLGLGQANKGGREPRIDAIRVQPYTARVLLALAWSEWTAPMARDQRTINLLPAGPEDALLHLPPLVAAWLGLFLLLYAAGTRWQRRAFDRRVAGFAFLAAWLLLDMRWQQLLWAQLQDTHDRYAGKPYAEKLRHIDDADWYARIDRLKREVLPAQPSRVFILRRGQRGHEFKRLRAQYFLLPHNVYNFGESPPPGAARPGDYLLVVGDIDGLRHDPWQQRLSWRDGSMLRVQQLHQDGEASLYRVQAPAEAQP